MTTAPARGLSAGAALGLLLIANAALAVGPVFVREGVAGPVAAGFWRMALALPFIALLVRSSGHSLAINIRMGQLMAVSGLFFAADIAAWHLGLMQTKLANATLLGNAASFLFPLYGLIIARRLPGRAQAIALLLAVAGAALLMGRSYDVSPQNLNGDLLSLTAGILYTLYLIVITRAGPGLAPWPMLFWTTLASAVPLLGFALAAGEDVWPQSWTPLFAMAVLSQVVGQGLLIVALGRLSPLIVGVAFLTQPIIAGLIGWLAYGERLGPADWAGALMVGLALVLVRQPDRSN